MKALEGRGATLHATAIAVEAGKADPTILEPVYRKRNSTARGTWSGPAALCHRTLGVLAGLSRQGLASKDARGEWRVTEQGRRV